MFRSILSQEEEEKHHGGKKSMSNETILNIPHELESGAWLVQHAQDIFREDVVEADNSDDLDSSNVGGFDASGHE